MHSKVEMMGYLTMYKSKNRYFGRKFLFFRGGGPLIATLHCTLMKEDPWRDIHRGDNSPLSKQFVSEKCIYRLENIYRSRIDCEQ